MQVVSSPHRSAVLLHALRRFVFFCAPQSIFLFSHRVMTILQNLHKTIPRNVLRQYATVAAAAVKHKPRNPKSKTEERPFITCKRSQFNLLVPAPADSKFGTVPLASSGWMNYKSKGDHFTIHPTVSEDQIRADMQSIEKFLSNTDIPLLEQLQRNLKEEWNITQLTGVQSQGIPKIYGYHHVLIAAETGCGKTLTYLLPMVQHIIEQKSNPNSKVNERKMNTPLAVIITPGRELAAQIGDVAQRLCQSTDIKVKTVLGGNTKRLMLDPEFDDVDILVASMGALSKLVTTGVYRMQQVRHVVLDEADTLLDDSFGDKLCHFLKKFPFHRNHMQSEEIVGTQMILASATMPINIEERLQKIVDVQTLHEVVSPNLHKLMPHVEQRFIRLAKDSRPAQLLNIVKSDLAKKRPLIVFSNKSATSDYVDIFLNNSGVNCINLNGDMLMKIRIGRFEQFQSGECDVLSTTDVGSRGLDTTRARHVINFDFPLHTSDYIHRCGRIGRVGSNHKSLVTNFISSRREVSVVQHIEHAARTGALLPNVNANIKSVINKRIMDDMKAANIALPVEEEAF